MAELILTTLLAGGIAVMFFFIGKEKGMNAGNCKYMEESSKDSLDDYKEGYAIGYSDAEIDLAPKKKVSKKNK